MNKFKPLILLSFVCIGIQAGFSAEVTPNQINLAKLKLLRMSKCNPILYNTDKESCAQYAAQFKRLEGLLDKKELDRRLFDDIIKEISALRATHGKKIEDITGKCTDDPLEMVEDLQLPDIDGNISDLSPSEQIAQLDATLASAECEKTKWSYRYEQLFITLIRGKILESPGGKQFKLEIWQFLQDENKIIRDNLSEYKELKNSYQEAQTPDEKRDILQKIYVNFRALETAIKRQVEWLQKKLLAAGGPVVKKTATPPRRSQRSSYESRKQVTSEDE